MVRAALLLSGRVRGCAASLADLWRCVVEPLNADLFVSLDRDDDNDSGDSDQEVRDLEALRERAGPRLRGLRMERYRDAWKERALARGMREYTTFMEIGPHGSELHTRIVHNTTAQMFHNREAYRMLARDNAKEDYDLVVKFRADVAFSKHFASDAAAIGRMVATVAGSAAADPDAICVPLGRDGHGLNDQAAFGSPPAMRAYCSLYSDFLDYLAEGCELNAEKLLAVHLTRRGIRVERFDLPYSLVAARVPPDGGRRYVRLARDLGWQPPAGKNLVYWTVGGPDPAWAQLLELSLRSMLGQLGAESSLQGVDVLVMCDQEWLSSGWLAPCFETAKAHGKVLHVHETAPNADGVQASMRKVEVFDWPGIVDYEKVLYLDCDVAVLGDVSRDIFGRMDPDAEHLFVCTEAPDRTHRMAWFSLPGGYTEDDLLGLERDGVRPFNCGQFAFSLRPCFRSNVPDNPKGSATQRDMQEHFAAVRAMMAERLHKKDYFYEQSFMNHHFNLHRATDNGRLLDSVTVLHNQARELEQRVRTAVLYHVCDASMSRASKAAVMRQIRAQARTW